MLRLSDLLSQLAIKMPKLQTNYVESIENYFYGNARICRSQLATAPG